MAFILESSAFNEGDIIPVNYTCDGKNVSPPLEWSDVPDNTQSFAIIFDDPDASAKTWVHWVVYNIPAERHSFKENASADQALTEVMAQGMNDFNEQGYDGPCPPDGTHRYFLKLYALDSMLDLKPGATKQQVLKAMEGHILAQAELMCEYKRNR